MSTKIMQETDASVRLDKWLWAARFFKTRSLATKAINGGKVHLDGVRVKAGRLVKTGDVVKIRKDQIEFTVHILALSDRRGPASVARTLYEETEKSIEAREQYATQRKLLNQSLVTPQRRPNKKQRRTLLKTKRQSP